MAMTSTYTSPEPTREEVDKIDGATVIEFGAPWCGFCMAAQAPLSRAFAGHPGIRHIKVEDGKGKALGRSFRVKLWPTLVFLRDGREMARLVRPDDVADIERALHEVEQPA
jgi:thioredoxin 1